MEAKELERKINEKIGKGKNYEIDKNISLIRTLETDEIVLMDNESALNGHHLLKDATPEEIKRIADHFKFSDDEDDSMIPSDEMPILTPEQKKQQAIDNEFVPDDNGQPGQEEDLIPD